MSDLKNIDNRQRLKDVINERLCANRSAVICEGLSQILMMISTVVALSAGFYNINILIFITASLNTISVGLSKYSIINKKRSHLLDSIINNLVVACDASNQPCQDEEMTNKATCTPSKMINLVVENSINAIGDIES
jgi:hypothetical protein